MRKLTGRKRRHKSIRKKIFGTPDKPRLCVTRSNKNFSAHLIDDVKGHTVFSLSTRAQSLKGGVAYGGNVKAASYLGEEFAKKAKDKGFSKVAFDRAGYLFHGRVRAFADSARKNGLVF